MISRLLVANRAEAAVRIVRAAADLGMETVAVHSADDADSVHVQLAGGAVALASSGPAAYLDIPAVINAAMATGCDAVHPGYGFLAENSDFARACEAAGLTFVGPSPDVLELFGTKTSARALAERYGVPVLLGTSEATSVEAAEAFLQDLGNGQAMMIKALAGGGGRGMRFVDRVEDVAEAYERCRSEATAAFGNGDVYVERALPRARHIEVQVIGDGQGGISHLWERECSLQRQRQKLIEIAPAPGLDPALRDRLLAAAVKLATQVGYRGLGTFEFLVDVASTVSDDAFAFMEANPRLQVEHTVTEEVTGLDLVQLQLRVAGGASLEELGVDQPSVPTPRGIAVQARVNLETMAPNGAARPASGTLEVFEVPAGPGVRTDSFARAGYTTSLRYDSLLAKVIAHVGSPVAADAMTRLRRALREMRIVGVDTNVAFLLSILEHPAVVAGEIHTTFVEERMDELLASMSVRVEPDRTGRPLPLAEGGVPASGRDDQPVPDGVAAVRAPMQGTVVDIAVSVGDHVSRGTTVAVIEAMKMEHLIPAPVDGTVLEVQVSVGVTLGEGASILWVQPSDVQASSGATVEEIDPTLIRGDLRGVLERHELGKDHLRPAAVAKRAARGRRTARENLADLLDPGTFLEYGPLVVASQRERRSIDDLIVNTPADGIIGGIGRINGDRFAEDRARSMVMSYDFTVLAGTQGGQGHRKIDRMLEVARDQRLPVVVFTEGGGGRAGEIFGLGLAGLDCHTWGLWGGLSGLVPRVAINAGYCFAGNAALLGCADVVIATRDSNIGMAGPAMIEGGGLGVVRPEEIGPASVQVANGVIDIEVADEAAAVTATKQYLSYFQGRVDEWESADQRTLRHIVPENRVRVYDVREVLETLADVGSVLELRRGFGVGMITALARVEGRPIGIIANNPAHLGGAIDGPAADKAARFMQLCDAFDIPIVFLCDTPGIMVGPEVEKTGLVRHVSRLFIAGASLTVPFCTVVLRKAYGLGCQTMAGGGFMRPMFTISWPTGEFGGMGLEGAVTLGYSKELAAIDDPQERAARFDAMVQEEYDRSKALIAAEYYEIDDVVDPADTRHWISSGLGSAAPPAPRSGRKRMVDTW